MINAIVAVTVVFAAAIMAIEIIHYRERKDLYTRLMCRNADEYKRITDKTPDKPRESAHAKAVKAFREGKTG